MVPGLPSDQYNLTLGTSILGGIVAGYASRLQPDGTQPDSPCVLLAPMPYPVYSVFFSIAQPRPHIAETRMFV